MTVETTICKRCKQECPRRGPVQKYCVPCSEISDLARKTKWAREHPQKRSPEAIQKIKRNREYEQQNLIKKGLELNNKSKSNITWFSDGEPDLLRFVRIAVPFSWNYSKNRLWSMNRRGGHVFIRREIVSTKNALIAIIKDASKSVKFFYGKVWVDIFVQKPNNTGDAINVLDTIADCIKKAIGIDDRYFSIRRLDWEIVKTDPKIFIGIGQEIETPHFVCSYCGRHLPELYKAKHKRICLECTGKSFPTPVDDPPPDCF